MSSIRITLEELPAGAEEEIIIRCAQPDDDILKLIYALKARRDKLPCLDDGSIVMIEPGSVYYFEAVDDRVFAYCSSKVYEIKRKLYELEQQFENTDFLRISRSVIVNISRISKLTPAFNGRFEALLDNGERTVISRQYVPALKRKLGIGGAV